jgi:hypothetical protein
VQGSAHWEKWVRRRLRAMVVACSVSCTSSSADGAARSDQPTGRRVATGAAAHAPDSSQARGTNSGNTEEQLSKWVVSAVREGRAPAEGCMTGWRACWAGSPRHPPHTPRVRGVVQRNEPHSTAVTRPIRQLTLLLRRLDV